MRRMTRENYRTDMIRYVCFRTYPTYVVAETCYVCMNVRRFLLSVMHCGETASLAARLGASEK
jgi:hypothetical protein